MTIYMAVDLTTGSTSVRTAVTVGTTFISYASPTPPNYGSDWVFDSSTIISVCSNYDGSPRIGCLVQNLKLMYTIPLQPTTMPFSNISNPLSKRFFFS